MRAAPRRRYERGRREGRLSSLRADREDGTDPATATAAAPGALTRLVGELARAPPRACPLLVPGARVARYTIVRPIGHGGFGTVYEAHDTALNRLVALKVQYLSQAVPEAASEAEAAARLTHPNIAALWDAGVIDCGSPYLVYELLRGETLESRVARGPIPPRKALAIAAQVCRALAYAHAHGIVHRDVKPGNVFLTAEGEVKVLDFGVALLFGKAAATGGTPGYMAPEQRRGEPEDARTDLYGLGLVLRDMITGQPAAPVPGLVPPAVQRVLGRLLAEDPDARPRSAHATCAELEAAARAFPTATVQRRRAIVAAVAALCLAAAVGGVLLLHERWTPAGELAGAALPSIAVLPFADASAGKDQTYFSEGVAEEILKLLSRIDGLHVAGRTSSFALKGTGDDRRAVAAKLNVGALLEGSVRKGATSVRITARLVSASNGSQLWAGAYEVEPLDVVTAVGAVARAVTAALEVRLGARPLSAPGAKVARAYEQYLLGRESLRRTSDAGFRRAADAYRRAVELDPAYAPAWAGLAVALGHRAPGEPADNDRRAMAAADRAVLLDPELADGFAARALLRMRVAHDWAGAAADLDRAIALSPGDPGNHRLQGDLLASVGRLPEAIAALSHATDLDPLDPSLWVELGRKYMADGELDRARQALNRALELAPDDPDASGNLAIAFVLDGRPDDALAITQRYRGDEVRRLVALALAHHDLGHARKSQRARDALIAGHARDAAFEIAQVHAWRRENDRAFAWLEKARANRNRRLQFVRCDPLLRDLRQDERYGALLRRMNLAPP